MSVKKRRTQYTPHSTKETPSATHLFRLSLCSSPLSDVARLISVPAHKKQRTQRIRRPGSFYVISRYESMAVKVTRNKTATGKRITTRMIDSPMFLGDNRCFRFWIFIFYYALIRFVCCFPTSIRGNGRNYLSIWGIDGRERITHPPSSHSAKSMIWIPW